MKEIVNEKGASLLVEYLILMGILSVFVVLMSLQIHETLSEAQVTRVMENNLADVASKISSIYTDYILLIPGEGYIKTEIYIPSDIGGRAYHAELNESRSIAYVLTSDGKVRAVSSLGLNKFLTNTGRVTKVSVEGRTFSHKAETEEKPVVQFNRTKVCPFVPKPRIEFIPSSIAFEENVSIKVSFSNKNEITQPVNWSIVLWNGSSIVGSEVEKLMVMKVNNINGCSKRNNYDYECFATVTARIADPQLQHCNGSNSNKLLVSTKPEESNPYLVYEKWVEPRIVAPGDIFQVHLRLEGRGFFVEGATNLSVVHVIDVSGSMIWPTIFKNYSFVVNPNVIRETINLTQNGRLEIYAYTTSRLPDWYSNSLCRCNDTPCPWWNKGYDSSFIRLYVDGSEVGSAYTSGQALGKSYTDNNARVGNYTIEVVANAPQQINITLVVKFRNNEILNKTFEYLNREEVTFDLPPPVNYTFLAITGIQNLPNWDMDYIRGSQWSSYTTIENYTVSGQSRYWQYREMLCGDRSYTYQQGSLNVWLILPNSSKQFLFKGEGTYWYQARNNYGTNSINADLFIPYPQSGTYKIVVVPTTKNPVTFTATALIKRIDAAKLAGITFNSMLGQKDFVGLATFSTDAERIVLNSSPLRFMTIDKSIVNNRILGLRAELATDHSDGLYYGSRIFPIWNETGNNCSACISELRPLIVMLTDGEPTICNRYEVYYSCSRCTDYCSGGSWCEAAKNQALCIANYLKNNVKVNNFNISICTIGFSTDIGGEGQQFLRQMASLRPDNNEPCYFFAETSDELVEAYRTIFNAFQVAAKSILAQETLNVSLSSPFRLIGVSVTSSKNSPIPQPLVVETANNTLIRVNITSIQKDEVIELIVRLKVKDDAPYGEYDVNDDNNSFIQYTALDNQGNEIGRITLPITSTRDKVRIVSGEEAKIILR